MKVKLQDIPELPSGEHDYFLLPRRQLRLPSTTGGSAARILTYREVGQGQPVLLLHGLWTTAYTFRNLIPLCQDKVRLIIPELLADSGGPDADPSGLQTRQLSELFTQIHKGLQLEQPVLVGHAESGLAGLQLALDPANAFKAIITIGSACWLRTGVRLRGWWLNRPFAQNRWSQRAFGQPMRMALQLIDYADATSISRQELRLLSRGWTTRPAARQMGRILAATLDANYRRELALALEHFQKQPRELSIPVKLVFGDRDPIASGEQGEKLNRMLPGSELLIARQSSGAVHVEQPEFVARVILETCGVA